MTRYSVDLTPIHARGLNLHAVFMLVPMIFGVGRERHGQILREIAAIAPEDTPANIPSSSSSRLVQTIASRFESQLSCHFLIVHA